MHNISKLKIYLLMFSSGGSLNYLHDYIILEDTHAAVMCQIQNSVMQMRNFI